MKVQALLQQCRFSKKYKGYYQLIECIRIAREDENKLLSVMDIYREVAQGFRVSENCVERNIRTLIGSSWKKGGQEQMEKHLHIRLTHMPTSSDLIEIFVCYLNDHPE